MQRARAALPLSAVRDAGAVAQGSGGGGGDAATLYPHSLSTENYQGLSGGEGINVFDHVGNSAMVSVGATIATVVLSTLGGYAFARLRFPGSNIVFFVTLATFMIPFQAIITPLYILLKDFGLQNSLLGLTIVYTTFQCRSGCSSCATPSRRFRRRSRRRRWSTAATRSARCGG
jgi:ABC-type glycerol-3-phosphate transport system permease component